MLILLYDTAYFLEVSIDLPFNWVNGINDFVFFSVHLADRKIGNRDRAKNRRKKHNKKANFGVWLYVFIYLVQVC